MLTENQTELNQKISFKQMKKKWVSQQNQSSELFSNFLKNVFVYDIIAFAKTLLASLHDFFSTSATIITSCEFFFLC